MVTQALTFIYLALYPLGQLPGFLLQQWGSFDVRFHLTDIVVVLTVAIYFYKVAQEKGPFIPSWLIPGVYLVAFGFLTIFISAFMLQLSIVASSLLYPVRIISYFLLAAVVASLKFNKKLIFDSLLVVAVVTAFNGWVQYIFYPDLRTMKLFNWDDHYFRMVGAFFDPAFLGMILVMGIILAVWKNKVFISLFLTLSLAFTYSRASWLALFIGLGYFVMKKISVKISVLTILILLIFIPLLPKPGGEGVNLARVNSAQQKLVNYQESVEILSHSPLFGVGLNNLCQAKHKLSLTASVNSCAGLDNSILFIVATTGVIGMFLFIDLTNKVITSTQKSVFPLLMATFLAVLIHSQFTLTIFYPWVMGWLAILIGVSRRDSRAI